MFEPRPRREWRFYLEDMLRFAQTARDYTEGLDQSSFVDDRRSYDATLRNLELIGEAARSVPEAIRAELPQVPWRQVIATRNHLIHAYLGIDDDTIWSILQDDLPALIQQLDDWLNAHPEIAP